MWHRGFFSSCFPACNAGATCTKIFYKIILTQKHLKFFKRNTNGTKSTLVFENRLIFYATNKHVYSKVLCLQMPNDGSWQ